MFEEDSDDDDDTVRRDLWSSVVLFAKNTPDLALFLTIYFISVIFFSRSITLSKAQAVVHEDNHKCIYAT